MRHQTHESCMEVREIGPDCSTFCCIQRTLLIGAGFLICPNNIFFLLFQKVMGGGWWSPSAICLILIDRFELLGWVYIFSSSLAGESDSHNQRCQLARESRVWPTSVGSNPLTHRALYKPTSSALSLQPQAAPLTHTHSCQGAPCHV